MGYYEYAKDQYEQPKENLDELWQQRLVEWRQQDSIISVENPTRLPKARELGYKAKKGFNTARVKVKKGATKRKRPAGGRSPRRSGQSRYSSKKSKQVIAEQRAAKKFSNLEVLNSYWVCEDGNYKWYEIIMVDPERPEIQNDDDINWICDQENRAERGVTPAAKKSRGLQNKGTGAEKVRPSISSNKDKGK
ncbi:MAG: 50S ribosomal protein L15e [Nanohaloarchaea archaeon]|nr:50S ribosomal protein L15e [Candidatus Nanohaloarchaea archaeon]